MACKKAKGKRAKTRSKLTRRCSRATPNRLLREIPLGTTVQIAIDSSVHSGMPHHRFQGKSGIVKGRQGRAYNVELRDGNTLKSLVIGAAHIASLGHAAHHT